MRQSTGDYQLAEEIIIDGLEEHAFRRSIEVMLRNGRADEAVERLRKLLPEVAGEGKTLPARLIELSPEDIRLAGWDQLSTKVEEYSRPTIPITAIGIGIGDPSDNGLVPDAAGNLRPPLETSYYSDATFPFSETDRADLLEGYSAFGCEWPDTDLIRAGAIGACYLGVMVWQAARRAVIEQGLPRPMAILLVNSDAYPFFDAPVMTCDEYLDDGAVQVVTHEAAVVYEDVEIDEPETASLIGLSGMHREKVKKMALVLEGDEAHNPLGMADDLVAQAAFDPSSVDISRFMPDASEFRNEPDEDDDLAEPFDEFEFPVETGFAPEPRSYDIARPEEEIRADEPTYVPDVPTANPYTTYEDGFGAAPLPQAEHDMLELEAFEALPVAQSAEPGELPETSAEPHAPSSDLNMPWHGSNSDLPFATEPPPVYVSAQPASHSMRDRIRVTAVEEQAGPDNGGFFARLITRIKELFARR
jgi:hypothetical protein